ncbi:MAG: hypothetical protein ACJAXA_000749 [Candidatus Aldehydirespiratoraceae bacterium]|jgi:hypothetical protein
MMRQSTPFERNLFYVGADKAGSSWWHQVLAVHPQIGPTRVKDPFFFDRDYARGLSSYFDLFDPVAGNRVGLDVSHDYLYSGIALRRIFRDVDDPFVLVGVRDPRLRTLSALNYLRRHVRLPNDIVEAVAQYPETVARSCYAAPVADALEVFGADRVIVVDVARLGDDPLGAVNDVLALVGCAPLRKNDLPSGRVRSASAPRSRVLGKVMKEGANAARRLGAYGVLERAKASSKLNGAVFRAPSDRERFGVADLIDPAVLDLFAADTARLDALLGTDYSTLWARTDNDG